MKKIGNYIIDKADKLVITISGTIGGLVLAQFPQYLAQYLQRLGGHIDEANLAFSKYKLIDLAGRAERLNEGFKEIVSSPALLKLPSFIKHAEWNIARETLRNYTPGMTFDKQGLYYLVVGILIGSIIYGSLKYIIRKCIKSLSRQKYDNI